MLEIRELDNGTAEVVLEGDVVHAAESRVAALAWTSDLLALAIGDGGEPVNADNNGGTVATGRAIHALLVVEDLETSDHRYFSNLEPRAQVSWPYMVQDRSEHGGIGGDTSAWFAGAFTTIERDPREPTRFLAHGNLMAGDRGDAAEQLIEAGMRGISMDGIDGPNSSVYFDVRQVDESGFPIDVLTRIDGAQIMGGTSTPFAAFGPTVVWLDGEEEPPHVAQTKGSPVPLTEEPEVVDDGMPALVAAGGRTLEDPPAEWFANPQFGRDPSSDPRLGDSAGGGYGCHITVTDEGRIFGHLATWDTEHMSFPGRRVFAPRSTSRDPYGWFMSGQLRTADGTRVRVGPLTMNTGHADPDPRVGAQQALAHYDHTGTVVADIAIGEDRHGIWVAGAVRRNVSEDDVRSLLACDVSGDWRTVGRDLELVAVLCVNTPGFPVPRPRALAASGELVALVAAAGPAWIGRRAPALRRVAAADVPGGSYTIITEARLSELLEEAVARGRGETEAETAAAEERPRRPQVVAPPLRPPEVDPDETPLKSLRARREAAAEAAAS